MDAMVSLSQAWAMGTGLGPTRVGVFGYLGHRPTAIETIGGEPIPGTGSANKSFLRIGATAQVWLGNLELLPMVTHAQDDAALGGSTEKPAWNSALLEAHYVATPRLMVQGRYELLRNSKQADPAIPKTFGDADALALGFRAIRSCSVATAWQSTGVRADQYDRHGAAERNGSGEPAADPATKIRSLCLARSTSPRREEPPPRPQTRWILSCRPSAPCSLGGVTPLVARRRTSRT
jgi:hypothetical protein